MAADAKKSFTEADAQTRKALTEAVATTKSDLVSEVRRIFGGDSPELLERLTPLLDKFGAGLDEKVRSSTEELLSKAAKQFDPSDPTSPIARHTAGLDARHATHLLRWRGSTRRSRRSRGSHHRRSGSRTRGPRWRA